MKPNNKDGIRAKMRFVDNYTLWLTSLTAEQRVVVRTVGAEAGSDVRAEGIVREVTGTKIVAETFSPDGLGSLAEFWRVRTLGQGYPKLGETILEPIQDADGVLDQRVALRPTVKPLKECEFELDLGADEAMPGGD